MKFRYLFALFMSFIATSSQAGLLGQYDFENKGPLVSGTTYSFPYPENFAADKIYYSGLCWRTAAGSAWDSISISTAHAVSGTSSARFESRTEYPNNESTTCPYTWLKNESNKTRDELAYGWNGANSETWGEIEHGDPGQYYAFSFYVPSDEGNYNYWSTLNSPGAIIAQWLGGGNSSTPETHFILRGGSSGPHLDVEVTNSKAATGETLVKTNYDLPVLKDGWNNVIVYMERDWDQGKLKLWLNCNNWATCQPYPQIDQSGGVGIRDKPIMYFKSGLYRSDGNVSPYINQVLYQDDVRIYDSATTWTELAGKFIADQPTIDTVNSGATVTDEQTEVPFTTTGMASAVGGYVGSAGNRIPVCWNYATNAGGWFDVGDTEQFTLSPQTLAIEYTDYETVLDLSTGGLIASGAAAANWTGDEWCYTSGLTVTADASSAIRKAVYVDDPYNTFDAGDALEFSVDYDAPTGGDAYIGLAGSTTHARIEASGSACNLADGMLNGGFGSNFAVINEQLGGGTCRATLRWTMTAADTDAAFNLHLGLKNAASGDSIHFFNVVWRKNASTATATFSMPIDSATVGSGSVSTLSYLPADPEANQRTREVLGAFQYAEANNKVIIGQHIDSYVFGISSGKWQEYVEDLHTDTGEYPAITEFNYVAGTGAPEKYPSGSVAHDYWKAFGAKGGIAEIHYQMQNPTTGTTIFDGDNADASGPLADLSVVYSGAYKARFDEYMQRVLDGILDLQDAGVTVIFRPFHEANGKWFWWHDLTAKNSPITEATKYKALWRYVFNYMKNGGAHNILWCWSPSGAPYSYGNMTHAYLFYPGDDYVDMIGIDNYPDTIASSGFPDHWNGAAGIPGIKSINKVKGFGEFGFKTTQSLTNMLDQMEAYPGLSFAMLWNKGYAISNSSNPAAFMNDPRVITLRKLNEIIDANTVQLDPTINSVNSGSAVPANTSLVPFSSTDIYAGTRAFIGATEVPLKWDYATNSGGWIDTGAFSEFSSSTQTFKLYYAPYAGVVDLASAFSNIGTTDTPFSGSAWGYTSGLTVTADTANVRVSAYQKASYSAAVPGQIIAFSVDYKPDDTEQVYIGLADTSANRIEAVGTACDLEESVFNAGFGTNFSVFNETLGDGVCRATLSWTAKAGDQAGAWNVHLGIYNAVDANDSVHFFNAVFSANVAANEKVASKSIALALGATDTTAPIIYNNAISLTQGADTDSDGDLSNNYVLNYSATTNELGGTWYYYRSASATPPSAANLKSGSGASWSNSIPVTKQTQLVENAGLTFGDYCMHVLVTDSANNDSQISTTCFDDGLASGGAKQFYFAEWYNGPGTDRRIAYGGGYYDSGSLGTLDSISFYTQNPYCLSIGTCAKADVFVGEARNVNVVDGVAKIEQADLYVGDINSRTVGNTYWFQIENASPAFTGKGRMVLTEGAQ